MNLSRRGFVGAGAALLATAGVAKSAAGLEAKPIGGEKTHFAGRDPRKPGFTEANCRGPFKVMFIGAHPDDPDFQCGSLAHKVCKAGGHAVFLSCCNGNKGHQWMSSDALAKRRYGETQASAKALGIDKYYVWDIPDCEIVADMALRDRIIRIVRQEAPNLLITHRVCDYHTDHRAVANAVRDATYLFGVPLCCPDAPVPETLPFVMYSGDSFVEPAPFRADLMVGDDDVLDVLLESWASHASQEFEWLPPEHGFDVREIPADHAARLAFIREKMMPGRPTANGKRHRRELDAAWGGKGPRYAEVFELCPYARPPAPREISFLRSLGAKWVGSEQ